MVPGCWSSLGGMSYYLFASSLCHDNRRAEQLETLASALFNLRALEKGSESGEEEESIEELAGKMLGWWEKNASKAKRMKNQLFWALAALPGRLETFLPIPASSREKRRHGMIFKLHQQLLPPLSKK